MSPFSLVSEVSKRFLILVHFRYPLNNEASVNLELVTIL